MSERLFHGSEVLNKMSMEIVTDPARKQTFAPLGDGAKHVFCDLLVRLHRHAIWMTIGVINACTDEYRIGVDQEKSLGI